ncbi:MAG: hypothetical protein AAB425_15380, partial [Bdellovibrionota bacterium]
MQMRKSKKVGGMVGGLLTVVFLFGTVGTRAEPTATTLAVVNGKSITERDLTLALSGMNDGQRQSVLKDLNMRREII